MIDTLVFCALMALIWVLVLLEEEEDAKMERLREANQKALQAWDPSRTLNHPFRLDLRDGGCEMVDRSRDER